MDLQRKQRELLHAYRMAVRGGLTSREQVLTLDMSSVPGIGLVRGQLLKDAAATYTDVVDRFPVNTRSCRLPLSSCEYPTRSTAHKPLASHTLQLPPVLSYRYRS